MVGSGNRGTQDAIDCLKADRAVEIVAIAEMFQDRVLCTKGATVTDRSMGYIEDMRGKKVFTYDKPIHSGEVSQFENLIRSIREGKPINECRRIAESTMTLILGRMRAYTGRAIKVSKLDLSVDPVAVPGKTQLI